MTLREIRTLARKRPEQEFALNRLYGAHVSPFFTMICVRAGLSPDQVTLVGAFVGAMGVALLVLPLGWWSLIAVALLQAGYILDFSDGQVARLTGRSSVAGSYLDWLTHFYIPVAMALAVATSLVWSSGYIVWFVLGSIASLELAAFAFSCREHVLIAMQRKDPSFGSTAIFHAALRDDARPDDVVRAPEGAATVDASGGIAGRTRNGGIRAFIGEVLIYPGAVHLVTLAVMFDLAARSLAPALGVARAVLLIVWALVFPLHLLSSARRNHRLIQVLERRARPHG
jgi:phosphatidylglycerophosphate synthase